MNVISLLTPKAQVAYLYDDFTVRQGLEKLRAHGYTAIPVLARGYYFFGHWEKRELMLKDTE